MPKSADQKLKLIHLLLFLRENTDEEHLASMSDILNYLERNGISAERKSIYTDVEALNRLGYEVCYENRKGATAGYYLANREFELAELKLLVDAVASSKFITKKKSDALIAKLEKMTSRHHAVKLQRQVYATNRVKTINESVLYTIDSLHEAISSNRQISFHYCEWNRKKELVYRNGGKIYRVDPVALIWDDENYYLVAYECTSGKPEKEYTDRDIRHYRVDKIRDLVVLSDRRVCRERIENFHPDAYVKEHFGMFSGKELTVKLEFDEKLIGVMIDRFGTDIPILPAKEGLAATRIRAQVSDQFFGWVSGFRAQVRIVGPDEAVQAYKEFIDDIRDAF